METETAYITKKGFADSGLPTLASLERIPFTKATLPSPYPRKTSFTNSRKASSRYV